MGKRLENLENKVLLNDKVDECEINASEHE